MQINEEIEVDGQYFTIVGEVREWNPVPGYKTPEGSVCEICCPSMGHIVTWDLDQDTAMDKMKVAIQNHIMFFKGKGRVKDG